MDEWKVFETESMVIVARSKEEVLDYLENELYGDKETALNEVEGIKEIDTNKQMSMTFVDDTEINEADYLEYEITRTDEGQPIITAPYSTFVKDMVEAGDVPGVLACWEY